MRTGGSQRAMSGTSVPRGRRALAAPREQRRHQTGRRPARKAYERRSVQRHAVVLDVPAHDRPQIGAQLRDGAVHALPQLRLHGPAAWPAAAVASSAARTVNCPLPRLPADVREAEEVEGLRLPLAARLPVSARKAAELDQARLLGVQLQAEPREALAQRRPGTARPPRDAESPRRSRRQSARRRRRRAPAAASIAGPRGRTRSAGRCWPAAG